MKNSATLVLVLLLGLLLGACKSAERAADAGDASMAAMTMEQELIAQSIEAQGGLANIQAVESLQMTGEVYMPVASMTMPLTIYQKRPAMMRAEVDVAAMGVEVVSGYDGETAWMDNPMQGGLQKLSGEQARNSREQADIDGFLVDYEEKGYAVEVAGEETVREATAKKLKVTRPDSSIVFAYLDAETHLLIKTESEGTNPMTGGPAAIETYFSDYREVDGIMRPYAFEVHIDGQLFQKMTLSDIKTNVAVDDAMFMYPKK